MVFFVNATAADIGGLHTIVVQFLESISKYDQCNDYYIFVSNSNYDEYNSDNVRIVKVYKKQWTKRLLWDAFGMKKWSKDHLIYPDKIISLQNTPVRFGKGTTQIVYLHTSIPFVSYNWSIKKQNERKLWFYKNIYPFFIKMFLNKRCEFIVQTNWLKRKMPSFLGIHKDLIHVIKPNVSLDQLTASTSANANPFPENKLFFYPAMDYVYKNHITILKALVIIKDSNYILYKKIKVIFTLDTESLIYDEAIKLGVTDAIEFVGSISFNDVLKYYSISSTILFPSFIETVGLPLIEAGHLNKFIICADEEYSREALENYGGVKFVTSTDPEQWAEAIVSSVENGVMNYRFNNATNTDSWKSFFEIVKGEKWAEHECGFI